MELFFNNLLGLFLVLNFITASNAQSLKKSKISSNLYLYDLIKKKSKLLKSENRHIEAPNWDPNNNFLIINSNGRLEKYDTEGNYIGVIPTGSLNKCNNDHGISYDGKNLFFSSGKRKIKGHSSFIYKVSILGGKPELLTENSPSYWHGVSPNGKDIVYTAKRNNNYDIYIMNIDEKKEVRLTFAQGLDDGPEYSPDGKFIYFNSFREGKMEIWRMLIDGSSQEKLTHDDYSNWFPHVAPDNKKFVFLSYVEDQKQNHPFGKNVKLRLYNLITKSIEDITPTFIGGQGTINVSSWSPDGTKFAYISYSFQ